MLSKVSDHVLLSVAVGIFALLGVFLWVVEKKQTECHERGGVLLQEHGTLLGTCVDLKPIETED